MPLLLQATDHEGDHPTANDFWHKVWEIDCNQRSIDLSFDLEVKVVAS